MIVTEGTYSVEQDLKEARAMVENLQDYLLGDQLYGSTGGGFFGGKMPSLTIGALLLRLRRLNALSASLTESQSATLASLNERQQALAKEWHQHYRDKMIYEVNSRLKAMDQYFSDCADDPRSCANNYLPEALRRTIAQELLNAIKEQAPDAVPDVQRALAKADSGLRRYTVPSDFVWSAVLSSTYPQTEYWWLYQRPNRVEKR